MALRAPPVHVKSRRERVKSWLLQGAVFLAIVVGMNLWQTRTLVSGQSLPAGIRATVQGGPLDLSILKGHPTLVAVWAPWCGVCAASSGNVRMVQKLVGTHAQVISIAMDYPTLASVQGYMRDHAVTYPVVLGDGALGEGLRVQAYPTVYFLDSEGKVKHSSVGYTTTLGMLFRLFL